MEKLIFGYEMVPCSTKKMQHRDVKTMDTEEDEVPENVYINQLIEMDSPGMSNDESIVPKLLEQSNTLTSLLNHVISENSEVGKIQEIETEAVESSESGLEFENWALKAKVTELEENLEKEKNINAQYASLWGQVCEEVCKKDPNFWEQCQEPSSSCISNNAVPTYLIASVEGQDGMPAPELQDLVQPVQINSSRIFLASTSGSGSADASKDSQKLHLVNATELLLKIRILEQNLSTLTKEKAGFAQLSQQLCQKWMTYENELCTVNPLLWLEFDSIIQNMMKLTAPVCSNPEVKVSDGQDSAISSSSSSGCVASNFTVVNHGTQSASPEQAPNRTNEPVRVRQKTGASGGRHKCEICGVVYKYAGSLYHHMKTHSLPNGGKVSCSYCGTKVTRGYSLRRHQQSQQCMKARKVRNTK